MNSWTSRLLSACAPPLMMFIIGTGITGLRPGVAQGRQVPEQRLLRMGGCSLRRGQ